MAIRKLMDGREVEIWPVSTRVRHVKLGFTGSIVGHECHESGVLSAIPYRVSWDPGQGATFGTMGFGVIYADTTMIEKIDEDTSDGGL